MFNGNKFKAEIVKAGLSMEEIANHLGINAATLYRKIQGKSDFTRNEIAIFKDVLGLDMATIDSIFFAN